MTVDLSDQVVKWIRSQLDIAGASGLVLGLSGGLDSSVCAALCKAAAGENVLGIIMPCHSIKQDIEDAKLIGDVFNVELLTIDLGAVYDKFMEVLPEGGGEALTNLKPRLRMSTLYYVARDRGLLVVGTGNKSEFMSGYFTKHGDGAADLLPLRGIYKTEVVEMGWKLGVPERIIEKPPSAGLREGQTDEAELGMRYRDLDYVLKSGERGLTPEIDKSVQERVKELVRSSEHKRADIPVFIPER